MSKSKSKKLVKVDEEEKSEIIELKKEKTKEEQVVDLVNNIFNYKNTKFTFIRVGKEVFFKGKEIAEFLKYTNPQKAIRDHVREKYRTEFGNLGVNDSLSLTWNEKNTIYISQPGVISLITKSNMTEAEAFQDYLFEVILPSIFDTGSFSLVKKVILDTSFIKSFYDDNSISDFFKLNVVYLGVIGMFDGGLLIKFGRSERVFDRDYTEHRKTFGNQFKIVCIIHTDNSKEVEDMLKQIIKAKGLDRKINFNGKDRIELCVTSENFTLDNIIDLLKSIAEKNQLPALKEKEHKIKELEQKIENDKDILIEKEHTKQKELDLKIKQVEKDKEVELKKMDVELQIEMKKLDLKKYEVEIESKRVKPQEEIDKEKILEYFEFTGNQKDIVPVSIVNKLFTEKFQQRIYVLRQLMFNFGADRRKVRHNGERDFCYICCKLKK